MTGVETDRKGQESLLSWTCLKGDKSNGGVWPKARCEWVGCVRDV